MHAFFLWICFSGFLDICIAIDAFQFSAYYGDHMVIQKTNPTIWGYSQQVNDEVHIKINGKEVGHSNVQLSSTQEHTGIWQVNFPAPSEGHGPYTITAQSSNGSLTLHDVWFGDVWVCSGQSNMEYAIYGLTNATEEYQDAANYQHIRLFKVAHNISTVPLDDLNAVATPWSLPRRHLMSSFSAVCWLFGKYMSKHLNYPIGLVETNWGGTQIEAWSSPDALAACPTVIGKSNQIFPSSLWNGMVNPLLRNSIYGAIWYQGESNSNHYQQYACQFPTMIEDWRKKFNTASNHATNQDFPFGFVQLSAWRNQTISLGFPGIRWAQTANMGQVPNAQMKNVFMAVGMDLPDFSSPYGSIHPRYKHTIAERLVLSGYAVAYGHNNINYHGPFPSSFNHLQNNQIQIEYDNNANPIEVRTTNGFDVCCARHGHVCADNDHGWKETQIVSNDTTHIYLDGSVCNQNGLTSIVGVRYAWRESPCPFKKCAIYGLDNGLPGPPFIHSSAM